jgi:hypothetical protein
MMVPAPFLRFTARVEFDRLYVRSSHDEMPSYDSHGQGDHLRSFWLAPHPGRHQAYHLWASWEIDRSSSSAGRSARTCALVISKCVREHLRRPVIEAECKHSAVGRLHPKQPIARLSIPTARDGLDRSGFDKSIGNLRVAERAPRPVDATQALNLAIRYLDCRPSALVGQNGLIAVEPTPQ